MASLISTVDEPNQTRQSDTLNTSTYADALAHFAIHCETPLTIGIQGECGSGKTSLLHMVCEAISETEFRFQSSEKRLTGSELCKTIWINTWEHSLLKSPKECLISVLAEIIREIGSFEEGREGANKATQLLKDLGSDKFTSSNQVKSLRLMLSNSLGSVIRSDKNLVRRFVVMIDDLDRIDPSVAIQILELLKNTFSLKNCVFILAVDYQVVIKGLRDRFGELNDENEWQFRAFFDKLIQLPFSMPMAAYDLDNYVYSLLGKTSFLDSEELSGLTGISRVIRLTIGSNPRSLKRLANSISLINLYHRSVSQEGQDSLQKAILLSLVCIQISFPKVYELLMMNPLFPEWDDDFALKATRGEGFSEDVSKALDIVRETHEVDFDEPWEQALFKIVWTRKWQRNKVIEMSRVLSVIKDEILGEAKISQLSSYMDSGLKSTGVTLISTAEEIAKSTPMDLSGSPGHLAQVAYWKLFKNSMGSANSLFKDIPEGLSSVYLARKDNKLPHNTQFILSMRARPFCRFESICGDANENYRLFKELKSNESLIEDMVGAKLVFKLDENSAKQSVDLLPPDENLPKRGMICHLNDPAIVSHWVNLQTKLVPQFENAIRKALEFGLSRGDIRRLRAKNAAPLNEDFALEVQTTTGR
jgi:ABC-type antimicrobial peptide transport system ATPase subunit